MSHCGPWASGLPCQDIPRPPAYQVEAHPTEVSSPAKLFVRWLCFRLIQDDLGESAVSLIKQVSLQRRNVKQNPLIFALAMCARSSDAKTKAAAYTVLNDVCRIPTHLFMFVKFCEQENDPGKVFDLLWCIQTVLKPRNEIVCLWHFKFNLYALFQGSTDLGQELLATYLYVYILLFHVFLLLLMVLEDDYSGDIWLWLSLEIFKLVSLLYRPVHNQDYPVGLLRSLLSSISSWRKLPLEGVILSR